MKYKLLNQKPPQPSLCQGCLQTDCAPKKCDNCEDCITSVNAGGGLLILLSFIIGVIIMFKLKNN